MSIKQRYMLQKTIKQGNKVKEHQRRGVTSFKHVVREGFCEAFTEKMTFKQRLKVNWGLTHVNI